MQVNETMKMQLTRRCSLRGSEKGSLIIRGETGRDGRNNETAHFRRGAASRKSVIISAGERIGEQSSRVVEGQQP